MILGIDPGHKGAIAVLDDTGRFVDVTDMPTLEFNGKTRIDGVAVRALIRATGEHYGRIEYVVIEQVGPSTSPSGSFIFGRGVGRIEGVVDGFPGLPLRYVSPQKWKKHFGLPADKAAACGKARELWPAQAHRFVGPRGGLLDGRAEAALIARFYVDTL